MDYEKEFYEFIKKKADEIESSDISENEKSNLYQLVDENIQKYVKMQILSLRNKLFIATLNETQMKIDHALERIVSTTKMILSNPEEIVKQQRTNENIFLNQNDAPFYHFSNN